MTTEGLRRPVGMNRDVSTTTLLVERDIREIQEEKASKVVRISEENQDPPSSPRERPQASAGRGS